MILILLFTFAMNSFSTMNDVTTTPSAQALTAGADLAQVVEVFCQSQDVAKGSRDLYKRIVLGFFDWVRETGREVRALSLPDVIAYKDTLTRSGKSSLTVASYVNGLRRFYTWAEANKLYPNIAQGVHAPKRKQEFRKRPLSIEKVCDLLRLEQRESCRDFAIINLMIRTGLRCVEVSRANVEDITYIGNTRVLMVRGKGHTDKDDFVILTEDAYTPIADYLTTRHGTTAGAPLFVSVSYHVARADKHKGESDYNPRRLSTRTISAIAKKALRSVGLNNKVFTAHSLRHTAGTNVLRAGGTIEQAQFMLRHTSPATTQIYTATLRDEQRLTNGGETLLDQLISGALETR